MKNGVVDEFDASLHPMALMSIINTLFRRDEIKFVERDDVKHFSSHYSLSDFGTAGKKGVRKHEDYMKNYFISQYGAINDIDFTSIFESILNDRKEV